MPESRLKGLSDAKKRNRCRFDPLALSEALGYNFHEVEHGAELIASVGPKILPLTDSDVEKEGKPLFDLDALKSRLVLWSRGTFKTSAVALYIVQLILVYPDVRILLMQSTAKNTRGLLREIKSHFNGENPESQLPKLFPEWVKTDREGDPIRLGTADGFICPARKRSLKEPTVSCAGSKTSKTGQHYDFMFFDDLVTDVNFRNQELQEKLIEDFSHLTPLLEPGGYKTVTGTRYSFGDLYGWIIAQDANRLEWHISVKTCWKDKDRKNGPLFPQQKTESGRTIGFTPELLDKIRADNPEIFSCQYLNQPIAAGQQLFTEELLMRSVVAPQDPRVPALTSSVLFIDLAASQKNSADHSVVLCGRQDGAGRAYVCDIKSGVFSPTQVTEIVMDMALRHRPGKVLAEGTAAGTWFIEYLKVMARNKGIFLPVEPIKVSNNKDAKHLRIAAIEGVLKTGKLFFLAGLPGWTDIVEQFTTFPKGRHDDEIDTISLMVQHYTSTTMGYVAPPPSSLPAWIFNAPAEETFMQQVIERPTANESCGDFFVHS